MSAGIRSRNLPTTVVISLLMIFITINDIHKRIIVFIVIVAMVINNIMARCSLGSRAVGFYTDFEEIPDDSSEGQYYEVEILVDRRIRRVSLLVSSYFFLLATHRVMFTTWFCGQQI